MIKENIEQVGKLVDVDSADLKQKKGRKIVGYFIHYFIQVFVLLLSSLMGYLFLLWEHSDRSGYPYTSWGSNLRHYNLGPISLIALHGGNAVHSYFHKKKYNRRFFEVYPVILVNLIISFISFFMIFNALYQEPTFYGVPLYGVFNKGNLSLLEEPEKQIRL